MKRSIDRLKNTRFDILVIGGGINGCAIARDAALRGAQVALIEKNDFACGASGNTTKLIHGGLRYLEQLNFKLVYESLYERALLLRTVPHLVKPLEFIIPVYKNDPRSLLKIRVGVSIYDFLAGKENIRPSRSLKREEVISIEKCINPVGLRGGVIYCDSQTDDIRLCLDNAISAFEAGACIANKVEARGFIKEEGRIRGVEALDNLNQEQFLIRARVVVGATGAWSNLTVKMDEPQAAMITRPTKGIHIVYRKIGHERAIFLSAHKDKRMFFIIPWRGYTLIGTTDTDFSGSPDQVYAEEGEVDYLLNETRRVFPNEQIDKKGIITTFAGLRPLVNSEGRPEWQVSREHLIKEYKAGLICVVGGKYTTYRRLAEEVVDLALLKLGAERFKRCLTQKSGPSAEKEGKKDLRGLIEYFVKDEMANSLTDLLTRRLQLAVSPSLGLEHIQDYAGIMGDFLNWSAEKKNFEIEAYKEEARKRAVFN